ncbi:hypothetical protein [Planobispora takensis]|uniref:Uncharacterized protein n=1 Tax=Planobispora takensis TaxID=1367882 RepID=A0A8J3T2P9_9ACTN|nr:hypothetical protein [Planobispora takensis]GII04062.1 hypothetical protein Pta02_60700 [Planobispora takensis]
MATIGTQASPAAAGTSPGPPAFGPPPGAGHPRAVFAVVALAVFVSTLDVFIVNIAVPAIQADFGNSSVAGVSWVAVLGTPTASTVIGAHDDTRWFMIASAAAAAFALALIRPSNGEER